MMPEARPTSWRPIRVAVTFLPLLFGSLVQAQDATSEPELVLRYDTEYAFRLRFRPIEVGLPEAIRRESLLASVDDEGDWILGWFIYGDSSSRSVAVAMDRAEPSVLHVDTNRNRRLEAGERFKQGDGDLWRIPIDAEFLTSLNDYTHYPRSIAVRASRDGEQLELATDGVLRGDVAIADVNVAAVRMDRDANGRWSDTADRILVDVNGDDQVDPIAGRIASDAVWRYSGKRYVVQSDAAGDWLEFFELSGAGRVTPKIKLPAGSELHRIEASFVSQSGVIRRVKELNVATECPVGRYRVAMVDMEVSNGDATYRFRFSNFDSNEFPIDVLVDGASEVELIGDLRLTSDRSAVQSRGGVTITMTPLLSTSSGLYLIGSSRGPKNAAVENRLLAESTHQASAFANHSTGFS